ncbi:isopentenyl-diphosphate Delta-isomerase [Aestuariispira insulae]|uniref:Isopentenyl-diphosphate Delta-isomerase n=1 Tax=Aestuariispira insulae TaxID=1461337 RepID=A0A3D9H1H3_9PROT|nr:isopentenyl-diphosphate Delta-isomerase [Aestuariispira insulae]RED43345.1 isopentenyl-diphosphate delta-isomerase [Aestuariispira insulae]
MPINRDQVILVDEDDRPTGTADKMTAHRQGLLHRAFSVMLVCRDEGGAVKVLLQKRAAGKYHSAGLWSNSCCSHPIPGENTHAAAVERLQQELGIADPVSLSPMGFCRYRAELDSGLTENELDHVFVGTVPLDLTLRPNLLEVSETMWFDAECLAAALAADPCRFTAWLDRVWSICRKHPLLAR